MDEDGVLITACRCPVVVEAELPVGLRPANVVAE